MKVTAILKALCEFTEWYAYHRQVVEAAALQELAAFLEEHERKNVSDLAAAIRASRLQKAESIGSNLP
jgi:hypothetical protein